MESSNYAILLLTSVLLVTISGKASSSSSAPSPQGDFLTCLASISNESKPQVYVPNQSPSYLSILQSSINNLRFTTPSTPKPQFIITPNRESQVQAVVICCKRYGLKVTVRSGGHDFEGLSSTSDVPFVLVDLINLRNIDVNIKDNSAWVQGGATLGEVYYRVAEKSPVHGYPAGACPTVGVGGHISGGGFGAMVRKYGMSADHVLDARLINANGEILNRETMGEDLFWAIRGGGVASFGVLLAWKIRLVPVPPIMTVAMVRRTLEQGATDLVYKWQSVASFGVPEELFIALHVGVVNTTSSTKGELRRTVEATFQFFFLGRGDELVQLMKNKFPELGFKKKDCIEKSWAESAVIFAGFPVGTPVDILLNRSSLPKTTFKAKSDFVTKPIPKAGLEGIWKRFLKEERPELVIGTWGGKVNEIPEDAIAFPHRAGNMYLIDYVSNWDAKEGKEASDKHIKWMRELYDYMTPYVPKSPRTAFLNYRDLDLGQNNINGTSTYPQAKSWGQMYFKDNFKKLLKVKSKVDPQNFFISEQSIPIILSS
ncbi:hypothetical protein Scep_022809 [Stephania cephalantha]|uniref:FAD-binding PCMH-type domain-containing protein n=1 Tax=Stephania cephalantha TaxID=152367 RepID=A0AAP0F8M3_9MAGN